MHAHAAVAGHGAGRGLRPVGARRLRRRGELEQRARRRLLHALLAPQNVAFDPDSAELSMLVSMEGTAMGPVRPAQFLNAL